MLKNTLVFFGGVSTERDVSVITGVLTLNCIDGAEYRAVPVFVSGDGVFYTGEILKRLDNYKNFDYKKLKAVTLLPGSRYLYEVKNGKLKKCFYCDCAINCMHGKNGEDGVIDGLMRICGVPFCSPGMFSGALAIDKDLTKIALNGLGVACAKYVRLKRDGFFKKSDLSVKYASEAIGYPMIVKPARLGSSIAVKKVNDSSQLFTALTQAFNYDDKVICEEYVQGGRDLNCAVYTANGKFYTSEVEEAFSTGEILSFADKYDGSKQVGINRKFPAEIESRVAAEIKEIATRIYRKLDFSSIVRFDFLYDGKRVLLNEINAVPGSMAYYLFCEKLSQFSGLLTELIEDAIEKHRKQGNLTTVYASGVLSGDFSGIKK